jgi:hypothetical protein
MDATKLENLASFVEEIDSNSPGAIAEQQQQVQAEQLAISEGQAWAVLPQTIGRLVSMLAPELAELYSDERCQEWGDAMVPVAQKYGWGGPNVLPELGLLIATGTFAVPTYMIVKAKIAQMKAAAPQQLAHPLDGVVDSSVVPVPPAQGPVDGG